MYREITHNIQIEVEPRFVPEESFPERGYYFFSYTIRITNFGEQPTRLLSRHWIITDGRGQVHEMKGAGVVGEQPRLEPGQTFEYSSFCPLPTPTGNMRGAYLMQLEAGEEF